MKSIRATAVKNQLGIASIIVAGIIVIIITLIVTSFAVLMRREQRQALDKQLSTQAFYAAESGVNAAVKTLENGNITSSDKCENTATVTGGVNPVLGDSVSYSCVLIDNTPDFLVYNPIATDKSTIFKISASNITEINISWQPASDDASGNYVEDYTDHPLPVAFSTGSLAKQVFDSGILRLSLMPIREKITRDSLINETQTLFLYPNKGNSSGQSGGHKYVGGKDGQGVFINGECNAENTPNHCNISITGLSGTDSYYIRLKSIYAPQKVHITATNGIGDLLNFSGTQAVIDATGKANDVLRRIQVRVPIDSNYSHPEFGLETALKTCKRVEITPPQSAIDYCD